MDNLISKLRAVCGGSSATRAGRDDPATRPTPTKGAQFCAHFRVIPEERSGLDFEQLEAEAVRELMAENAANGSA